MQPSLEVQSSWPVYEGIENILYCVGWNPIIGIHHKGWKARLSLLQSVVYLILSVSLLSAAANGLGFEPPTCEKGFAIETCVNYKTRAPSCQVVDDEVWASLVLLAIVISLHKGEASTST